MPTTVASGDPNASPASHTTLDPVDPTIGGRIAVDRLDEEFRRKWSGIFGADGNIMQNLKWIRDPEAYAVAMKRYVEQHRSRPVTRHAWHGHLKDVRSWGICSMRRLTSDDERAVATSKYFAVLKEADRSACRSRR
jgi:hypothetical protein